MTATGARTAAAESPTPVNEVHLVGRVSGEPTVRELPSGDELVQFRLVVPRLPRRAALEGGGAKASVDTIDIACWSGRVRRVAARLPDGQAVEVHGSLHRRFFATAAGRASRYEVEAVTLRRVKVAGPRLRRPDAPTAPAASRGPAGSSPLRPRRP